jgi:hypothetical protein
MSEKVQVFALAGFDSAIIGTAYRGGNEVLAYDGHMVAAILAPKTLDEYLAELAVQELGDKAPVFLYLDEEVVDTDESRDPTAPLH